MAALVSAIVWGAIGIVILIAFLIDLLLWPFDSRRRPVHSFNMAIGRTIVRLNPFWKVRVIGPDRPPPGVFVVCANHQSNADIFCLAYIRKAQWRYLAKRELLRVPVFGWILELGGHVPVERGERASGEQALERCKKWLERGISVAFFPEGTRSETGQIKDFKMGAFKLAVEAQVPILPIAVTGTRDALPKHGWIMRERADVRIQILPPIPCGQDAEALRDRTRAVLIEGKAALDAL